jgi:spore maturation protein SpmB
MAITTSKKLLLSANAGIPTTYTPGTLPSLTTPLSIQSSLDLAVSGIEDADVNTTITNLLAALQTQLDTTFYPNEMGFNATLTINANVTIKKVERIRIETNDLVSGDQKYRCTFQLDWSI